MTVHDASYTEAGNIRSITGRGDGYAVLTCRKCGALVRDMQGDRALHDKFHEAKGCPCCGAAVEPPILACEPCRQAWCMLMGGEDHEPGRPDLPRNTKQKD